MADRFFEELKRRKVVRVGTMYVVAAWVLLQLGDVVIEPLGLPGWMQGALIVGVTAGLPVALVLSWLFDLTWGGLRRDRGSDGEEAADEALASVSPQRDPTKHRLAVLPFVDMSEGQTDAYLGDGVADEILHALAPVPQLEVIARASSFRFRGVDVDLEEMKRQLDVSHVLSGTIRRGGDRIRVHAELVDVASHMSVWSESYKRGVGDLFELEEELAGRVATTLVGVLGFAPAKRREMDPKAYDEFLIAVSEIRNADFPQAIEHAERSVALDPESPRAHALIADAYLSWTRYGYATGTDELTRARTHSNAALRVDPGYPSARVLRGMLSLYLERDFNAAFEEVIGVASAKEGEFEFLPTLLSYANRFGEAIAVERRITVRDPLNVPTWVSLARKLNWTGRGQDAAAAYTRARKVQPYHLLMIQDDIEMALRAGDAGEAEAVLDRAIQRVSEGAGVDTQTSWLPIETTLVWIGAKIVAGKGDLEKAHELAATLEADDKVNPTIKAETYLTAGDIDAAYRLCDLGIRQFDLGMYDLAYPYTVRGPDDPHWLAFRADPRYPDLLARLGIDEDSLARVDWRRLERFLS